MVVRKDVPREHGVRTGMNLAELRSRGDIRELKYQQAKAEILA
ncbi:hypothetical protein [Actinomadura sp. 3N508]